MLNNKKRGSCLAVILLLIGSLICQGQEPGDIDKTIESLTQAAVNRDLKEFKKNFTAVQALMPGLNASQRAQIFFLRGWAYQKMEKEYDLAIANYSESINIAGEEKWTFSSLVNRSGCYLDLKEYDKAMEDIEEALKIWPGHQIALNHKQLILRYMQTAAEGEN